MKYRIFTALAAAALLTLACSPQSGVAGSRVLVLGLDGMDPQALDLLMSEGKMPNFARLRQQGAYGKLRSQKPILSPIIWTTIATGKAPDQHGISHFVSVAANGDQLPVTSSMRQVKAIWNIASEAEKRVATVGWWATWPPETINGSIVSDHTSYHFLFEEGFTGGDDVAKTHPPELLERITPLLRRPADLSPQELSSFVDVDAADYAKPFDFQDDFAHFRWALATAQSYRDIGLKLWREDDPDLAMVYIEGTDSTSHLFGHLFRAEGLGGELAEQQEKFGHTVEHIYLFADQLLGQYMEAMDDDTVLVVLSDHGFHLGALHDDPSRTRDLRRVSEKFHRLDGILYLYGQGIKPGARLRDASILDITPTLLTLLGLAPAADMPGRALSEAFIDPAAKERIASYETARHETARHETARHETARHETTAPEPGSVTSGDARVSQAQLEHLKSLGYIGDDGSPHTSPEGDRNLAGIHFRQGQYRQAAELYMALVYENPDDASLRASLAGALGELGRYDQALEQLDMAIRLQPLNVEAYHNRAVIQERRGKSSAATADYETALLYNPQYEPSQRAYHRLTGRTHVRSPKNPAEEQAAELVQQASGAARRANYVAALGLLEKAEKIAPSYVLIYQYRSNVGYLMGDLDLGVAALEKALTFEPHNALFQRNLEQLRAQQQSALKAGQESR